MQGTSYTIQDFIEFEPHVEVWDENWDVLWLFERFMSQLRFGFNGPVALDMTVFQHELTRKKVPEATYDLMMDQLTSIIEPTALMCIRRNNS